MVRILAAAILAFTFTVGSLFAQEYKVDAGKSTMKWFGKKVTGQHWGTINIKDGTMTKSGDNYTGTFTIDMTTIKNNDIEDSESKTKLVNHLKSDDFFSVAKHNTSTFKLKSMSDYKPKKDQKGNSWVKGDLTIKGITHEIGFPADVKFDGSGFTAYAEFEINRAKWAIKYGSGSFFDNLGDKMIYDEIKFELSLVGYVK